MEIYRKIGLGLATLAAVGALTLGENIDTNRRVEQYLSNKAYNGVSDSLTLSNDEMRELKKDIRACRFRVDEAKRRGTYLGDGPVWDHPYE